MGTDNVLDYGHVNNKSDRVQTLRPGMSAEDLRSWASAHSVEDWLQAPVRVLQSHLRGAWLYMYRRKTDLTLERVLTLPTARGPHEASDIKMPHELQEAAIKLLTDQAELITEGLDDEQAHLSALIPPIDHRLQTLYDRLMGVRKSVRAQALPRAYRQQGPVELSLIEDPPQIVYREQTQQWCGGDGYFPEIHIDLQAETAETMLRCRCRDGCAMACPIGLSAIDATVNILSNSAQPRMREKIARLVSEPPWHRALASIDRLLVQMAPEGAARPDEEALGWRIRAAADKPLSLEPVRCRPLKSGDGLRSWKIEIDELLRDPQLCNLPIDQEVLAQLVPAPEVSQRRQPEALRAALVHRALEKLIDHPRVLIGRSSAPAPVGRSRLHLRWHQEDDYAPIVLQPLIDDHLWDVDALLEQMEQRMAGGLLVLADEAEPRCQIVRVEPGTVALLKRMTRRGNIFPAEAAEALIERRAAFERLLPVQLSASLRGDEVEVNQQPILRLQMLDNEVLRAEARVRPLADGPSWPPGQGPAEVYGKAGARRIYARRALQTEAGQTRHALRILPLPDNAEDGERPLCWTLSDADAALTLMESLEERGWPVEWAGPPRMLTEPANANGLKLVVSSRKDWFGLKGSLSVGGFTVPLQELLEAVWEGAPFLEVNGRWLRLESDFRDRLAAAASAIFTGKRGLEISPLNAPALGALGELGADITAPKRWSQLMTSVREAEALDVSPPAGLAVTLRDYQRTGFQWMARLAAWGAGACLADDMGLGKTIQSLALLTHRAQEGPAIVVAPTSVCFNWQREAAWVSPGLKPMRYLGAGREKMLVDLQPGDVLIVSYGLMRRD
ncbi:MAG: SNF2-related protein, partial [Myxococcota bacterium]